MSMSSKKYVSCSGMAEVRKVMLVESLVVGNTRMPTILDLDKLIL